ncbi:MAG: histidine phosphatase family protein [Desulfovibrionaceae bacterium]|nr:histidine phosphatase family protein [Desulfovibrionaceae bacterium]
MLREHLSHMQPVILVRHGQTDWNVAQRFQGQTDTALNARGKRQAAALGACVKRLLNCRDGGRRLPLFASPLKRAQETARILASCLAMPDGAVQTDTRLQEQRYGRWEGLTRTEVGKRFPGEMEKRARHPMHFRPQDGESLQDVGLRMTDFLMHLDRSCLVVTHSGNIVALKYLLSETPEQDLLQTPICQDALYVLIEGKKKQLFYGGQS